MRQERRHRIGRLHRRLSATLHDLLAELAAMDDEEGWAADGATDAKAWLVHELGLSRATARRWVEVAHRLDQFPVVAEGLTSGRLSVEQARPLCRLMEAFEVGTDIETVDGIAVETEADLAEVADDHTVAQLERLARRTKPVTPSDEVEDEATAFVETWWDHDRMLHLSGAIPGVDGAVVELALRHLATQVPKDPATGQWLDYDRRMAEALVQMATGSLTLDGDPDRATVAVHVDAAVLAGAGNGHIPDGPSLTAEAIRRLTCDGRWQTVADGPDGRPVGVGRVTRSIPPWLHRLVIERDEGCRFPGCGRSRYTHAHHIVHWAHGGPTDLANLVTLCGHHHRMLHREGWGVHGDPAGDLRWTRPDGRTHVALRREDAFPDAMPVPVRLEVLDSAFTSRWGPIPLPAPIRAGPDP